MSEQRDSRKKKAIANETPIYTIRVGAVAASILRRQSPAGYVYFDFSLTRSWQSLSSGNTGYSKNFFSRNHEELLEVIQQTTRWIAEHEQLSAATASLAA